MSMSKEEVMFLLGKRARKVGRTPLKHIDEIAVNPVKTSAQIAAPDARRRTIRVAMEIEDGWYVYGKPLVFPYTAPLSLDIRGSAIQEVLEIKFPPPQPQHRVEAATTGKLPSSIYRGKLVIEAKLLLKKQPAAGGGSGGTGGNRNNHNIRVSLRYQPCSSSVTLPPVHTTYRV